MLVMQIGACDGIIDGHRGIDEAWQLITQQSWNGILIEPNPRHFIELKNNYLPYLNRVQLLEYAITDYNGDIVLYDCDWSGASSCIEKVLTKNNYHNGKSKNYSPIRVKCLTINTILKQHILPDYLVIDAEGYDGIILETLDLDKYPIPKIRFEFSHLSMKMLGIVCLKLIKKDYVLSHDKADIIAQL